MHNAKFRGGFGRSHSGFRMESLQRSDRREDSGDAQRLPHERGGRVDGRHVNQDARPEGDPVKSQPVPSEGRFRLGTAYEIVPGPLVHAATSFLNNFLVADKIETHLWPSFVPS